MMNWFSGCCGFGGFGEGSIVGLILNLVIILGLFVGGVFLIFWIVRRLNAGGQGYGSPQDLEQGRLSPREILDVRYARGEIDREQYQQMLSDFN
ncbi:MAG: SHOCT domain-containing protein [Anaerolineales bacterium]|nr:SHOCT domain-containing protein [Anaerolineales bacterium]